MNDVHDFVDKIPVLTSVALAEGEAFLVNTRAIGEEYAFIEWVNNPNMPRPFEITTEKTPGGIRCVCKMTLWRIGGKRK